MVNNIAVVLAAGQGTRMKSDLAKGLHAAAGRPLINHVLNQLEGAGIEEIRLVIGFKGQELKKYLSPSSVKFFEQRKQLGTADAVKSAEVENAQGTILVCNGDHPLITAQDYTRALEVFHALEADILVNSCEVKNPSGFGRVVRNHKGRITGIVEEKEASDEVKAIREINSGLYVFKSEILKDLLPKIKNDNAKGEYYLTDIIKIALDEKLKVEVLRQPRWVARGVNTLEELAQASKLLYLRKAKSLMSEGVTILDPLHTYIEDQVVVGRGTVVQPGVMITGHSKIGTDVLIEAHSRIVDSQVGDKVEIRWGSLLEKSQVADGALIGPYARLRPESVIGEEAHIGNFVELKKVKFGARSKANHLTYLGDAEVGEETNLGCGTITCNYAVDKKKYKTVIGDRVFVGSDSQFVAPVKIGDDAVIASGSTITEDVPSKALALSRGRQVNKSDYKKDS